MGKTSKENTPLNASFSYTLKHLLTGVQLIPDSKDSFITQQIPNELTDELSNKNQNELHSIPSNSTDLWKPLKGKLWLPLEMNTEEQQRFLKFFKKLKTIFNLKNNYIVYSANNFPKSSGGASSASSFSALTKASYQQALEEQCISPLSVEKIAQISRQGSGSSCRSFFSPWCLWKEDNSLEALNFPIQEMDHDLILTEKKQKTVSSSEAHQRVQTSPFIKGRKARAFNRLNQLIQQLYQQKWYECYKIVKEEFEDMHNLFETSKPSFSYQTSETKKNLLWLNQFWKENKDGPLVTMDAGSTIHLLYRKDQKQIRTFIQKNLPSEFFEKPQ